MRQQNRFDFGRVDVFATTDEHLLGAPEDRETAVGVAYRDITGMQPPVADGLRGGLRVAPVACDDVRAANQQFSLFAVVAVRAVGADRFHVDVEVRIADRADFLSDLFRGQPEIVAGRLGQAVAHFEIHAPRPEFLHDRQRAGRTAADHQFQLGKIGLGPARVLLQHLEHRGHADVVRDTGVLDQVKGLVGIEAPAQDSGGADVHHRRHEYIGPADVEKRHLQRGAVILVDAPGGDRIHAVPGHIAVGQHGALGQTGGAAGVINAPGVVHLELRAVREGVGLGIGLSQCALAVAGFAHRDPVTQRVAGVSELFRLLAPVLAEHQHHGLAALDDSFEFMHGQAPVQVLQYGADLGRGPEQVEVGAAI